MSEILVIRWMHAAPPVADAAPQVEWLLVDEHGARLGAVVDGPLPEALQLSKGRRLIVLMPAAEVLHFEPVLPPLKGGAKPAQVVPFALEDQLASDVDTLHFALGKRTDRLGTPVAVIAHDSMQQCLIALRTAGISAEALYAENALLPTQDQIVSVLLDCGRVTVRRGSEPAMTLDATPLNTTLQTLLPDDAHASVVMYVAESEYDTEQASIETLRARVGTLQIKLLPDGVLPLLALQAVQRGDINLLQGPYTPRTSFNNQLQPWRVAATLVAAMVAAHVLTGGVKLWQLSRQEAALDKQIQQTYASAIPGGSVNANEARHAFESKLLQMQSANAGNGLMTGLDTLASVLSQTPDMQLDALAFRNDSIDLRLMAPSVDALEKIRQQAQARNMTAEIQSANPKDSKIDGRVQLKLPPGA
jgi:general secretion pathway protein L